MKSPTGRRVSIDFESYDLGRVGSPVIVIQEDDAPAIVCDLTGLEERVFAYLCDSFRQRKRIRKSKGWRRHVRRLKATAPPTTMYFREL